MDTEPRPSLPVEYAGRIMKQFNQKIEDRHSALLEQGFTKDEISIRHVSAFSGMNPRTIIAVRGVDDSEFWIDVTRTDLTINGRSLR